MKIKIMRKRLAEWHYDYKVVLITIGWLKRYEQMLFNTQPTLPNGWTPVELKKLANIQMITYIAEIDKAQKNLNDKVIGLGFDAIYLPQPELILRRAIRGESDFDL